jgi:hypothetical protein
MAECRIEGLINIMDDFLVGFELKCVIFLKIRATVAGFISIKCELNVLSISVR